MRLGIAALSVLCTLAALVELTDAATTPGVLLRQSVRFVRTPNVVS